MASTSRKILASYHTHRKIAAVARPENLSTDMKIHPTAIVLGQVGRGVEIGPFCIVDRDVVLGDNVVLGPRATVTGRTRVGQGTKIFSGAVVGSPPQDKKYAGENSGLVVGENCMIRENVTINTGTQRGHLLPASWCEERGISREEGLTQVGNNVWLLTGAHVGHDCVVEDDVILSNNVSLGGHVFVGRGANMGGHSAAHQRVRIGERAFVGGMSGVMADVVPFSLVRGSTAHLAGLNLIGLRRHKVPLTEQRQMMQVLTYIFEGEMRSSFSRRSNDQQQPATTSSSRHENSFRERIESLLFLKEKSVTAERVKEMGLLPLTGKSPVSQRILKMLDFLCMDPRRSLCLPEHHSSNLD